MTKTECDNCRTLGPCPVPGGWIITAVQPEPSEMTGLAMVFAGSRDDEPATFCSWKCVAEYAAVKALVPAVDPEGSGT